MKSQKNDFSSVCNVSNVFNFSNVVTTPAELLIIDLILFYKAVIIMNRYLIIHIKHIKLFLRK